MAVMQFFVLLVKQEAEESMKIYRGGDGTECTIGKAVRRGCLRSNEKTLKETLTRNNIVIFLSHTRMYTNVYMHRIGLYVNLL